jgi:hypothetical protein
MAKITRNTKASGGRQFQIGKGLIRSTEVDDDLDQIYSELDAGLDDANVRTAANIASSKIGDYSASTAEQGTRVDPGNAGNLSAATTLNGEIERLRYSLERGMIGLAAVRQGAASVGTDDVSWYDVPARAQNLIQNGSFAIDDDTAAANAAPPGWDLIGTPTLALGTETEAGDGNTLVVTGAGAADSGIAQSLLGLKPSTRYLVYAMVKVTGGGDTLTIETDDTLGGVGADATSDFIDLDYDLTSATHGTMAPVAAIFQTDSTPTDIRLSFLAVTVGDIFEIAHVGVYECNANPYHGPGRYVFRLSDDGTDTNRISTGGGWTTIRDDVAGAPVEMSISVNPVQGSQIRASAQVTYSAADVASVKGLRLLEDGTAVDVSYMETHVAADVITLFVSYTNMAPAPGTALTYTIEGASVSGAMDTGFAGTGFTGTPPAVNWLEVEVIVP